MNKEEKQLYYLAEKRDHLNVPDQLDHYILRGIEKGKRHRTRKKYAFQLCFTFAVIIFLFTLTVRVSPAFASTIGNIPGMEYIVQFIQGDKGLESAVTNNYIQKLGMTETKNGVTVTLDSMIADQKQMFIFYRVKGINKTKNMKALERLDIKNNKGVSVMGSSLYDPKPKPRIAYSEMDFEFRDNVTLTNPLKLQFQLAGESWDFPLPFDINKIKKMKKSYKVNKTVSLQGQSITFKNITVYPTRVAVQVEYDPKNSKQITHLDDLKLVDEKGETWASIKNGVTADSKSADQQTLYLQSNYFSNPKALYLELTNVRAIDKTKQDVVVNLKSGKVLKEPSQLKFQSVKKVKNPMPKESNATKQAYRISYIVKNPKYTQFYGIFDNSYKDQKDETYERIGLSENYLKNKKQVEVIYLPDHPYKEPVSLKITDYPSWIKGSIKIKLK